MTTTRCLSSRELIKPESVTHVLRQKCHPCPGLHNRYGLRVLRGMGWSANLHLLWVVVDVRQVQRARQ